MDVESTGEAVMKLMSGPQSVWRMPPPSAVISVTGGARSLDMTDKQQLVFRRGLLSAASITNAWIFTGGTDSGVMSMVGKTLAESEVPCIGVAPWGAVLNREKMTNARNKTVDIVSDQVT